MVWTADRAVKRATHGLWTHGLWTATHGPAAGSDRAGLDEQDEGGATQPAEQCELG
jgi:hypothetical protein